MKTSRYTEAQIIAILRQAEGGVPVAQLCRENGMSDASFYKWRAKYGGMDASMVSQLKAMEEENRRLKRMYHSLGFGIRRAFESGWQADANIDVSRETRDGIAPAFGVVRSETTQKLTLQITNRNVQYRGFSPVLQLGAERRRSNIEIYSYQNRFLGVSLSRGF